MDRNIKLEIGKLVWFLFFVLNVLFLFLSFPIWVKIIASVFIGLSIIFSLKGFRVIPEEQRWVIELLGKYSKTVGPGLVWLFPFIEKPRAYVSVWSQIYFLFTESEKIEFADGRAEPVKAQALVRCIPGDKDAPRRMVYEVRDVKGETVALLESLLREWFARLQVEEAFEIKHNVLEGLKEWNEKKTEEVEEKLRKFGLMVENITIADFKLDPDMEKARKRIQKEKEEKEAAKVKIKRNVQETGKFIIKVLAELLGKPETEIKKLISSNPELQAQMIKWAEKLTTERMASESNQLLKIDVGEGGELGKTIAKAVALINQLNQTRPPSSSSSTQVQT